MEAKKLSSAQPSTIGRDIEKDKRNSDASIYESSIASEDQEKTVATITVRRASVSESDQASHASVNSWKSSVLQFRPLEHMTTKQVGNPTTWRTTWIRFGPLSGICCLILTVASITACFGILAGSDGKPVHEWSVTPSTYIAIFTAIANLSMRYAAIQGVVIAWWVKALKGSTVAKLHWDWRSGTTLRGAITAGRHMGLLGLACVFSTVVVIDGPLLQRSTSVVSPAHAGEFIPLNVSIAPVIPFTGGWRKLDHVNSNIAFNDTIPTPKGEASNHIYPILDTELAAHVGPLWNGDLPIPGIVQGCPGRCKAIIRAPALFATSCTTKIIPVNYLEGLVPASANSSRAPPLEQDALLITLNLVIDEDKENINMITAFSTVNNCVGSLNMTVCTLEPGIGEYDVEVQNNALILDSKSTIRPKFVCLANNNGISHHHDRSLGGYFSTLGGIVILALERWASIEFSHLWDNEVYTTYKGKAPEYQFTITQSDQLCDSTRDPREVVMQSLNKLMVYTGAYAARQSSTGGGNPRKNQPRTTSTSCFQEFRSVFKTDYRYFLGAAIVELICIALVAPTYWGWWTLGRPVSLSPLETARAFRSPMLAEYASNSSGRDLAIAAGDQRVRYGATSSYTGYTTELALDDPQSVDAPTRHSRFDV